MAPAMGVGAGAMGAATVAVGAETAAAVGAGAAAISAEGFLVFCADDERGAGAKEATDHPGRAGR
jgi:hypothetical protein